MEPVRAVPVRAVMCVTVRTSIIDDEWGLVTDEVGDILISFHDSCGREISLFAPPNTLHSHGQEIGTSSPKHVLSDVLLDVVLLSNDEHEALVRLPAWTVDGDRNCHCVPKNIVHASPERAGEMVSW